MSEDLDDLFDRASGPMQRLLVQAAASASWTRASLELGLQLIDWLDTGGEDLPVRKAGGTHYQRHELAISLRFAAASLATTLEAAGAARPGPTRR